MGNPKDQYFSVFFGIFQYFISIFPYMYCYLAWSQMGNPEGHRSVLQNTNRHFQKKNKILAFIHIQSYRNTYFPRDPQFFLQLFLKNWSNKYHLVVVELASLGHWRGLYKYKYEYKTQLQMLRRRRCNGGPIFKVVLVC